ncbi:MAG: hypothetical protein IJO63_05620 [Bacilli bacterium]|nr:hypothetical protein [Bacilli bacterium]
MVDIESMSQLDRLEIFFACNMNIKKSIASLAFDETRVYNSEYAIRYVDEIDSELKYMKSQFMVIAEVLRFDQELKDKINNKFDAYCRVLYNCGSNPSKLHNFYRLCISEMSPELVAKVKKSFVGYSMGGNIWAFMDQNLSVNALLHVVHSYVMNNDGLYRSVDSLSQKKNKYDYSIDLRGNTNNQIAANIFENFPSELDVGWTDILSLKNKTLLMVRDRGHAMTIEIEEIADGIMIRYFIPKLCNIDMINALPGINRVPQNANTFDGARGEFMCSKDDICNNIYNFISRVPTDMDMPLLNDGYVGLTDADVANEIIPGK